MGSSSDALPSAMAGPRRSCILVVEDEILIRLVISDELRDAGHEVIEAVDGDEALAILKTGVRVDLIVSDVRMPGSLDGMGLLAIVRATIPGLPVIITSGHMDADSATAGGAACFVAKPYSLASIGSAVRDELARIA